MAADQRDVVIPADPADLAQAVEGPAGHEGHLDAGEPGQAAYGVHRAGHRTGLVAMLDDRGEDPVEVQPDQQARPGRQGADGRRELGRDHASRASR